MNDEVHEFNIESNWKTNNYNYFKRPPSQYSFRPSNTAHSFIRTAVDKEDLKAAETGIHPKITDFPWENLEHDQWSRRLGRLTRYEGNYLGFDHVFSTRITFGEREDDNSKVEYVQNIFMTDYDNEWKIIDISPLMEYKE
ncbi:hypothetical protein SYNTR_0695 [Candidatus Syntrophocurvum alkaliphilum]|uniref:Uncharacterized protein n=1 Tax=Candidatus Syntrophocurvum alkaliphilum TaxID=2293317 RepID=A0A6I6D8F4_9FIRM|nr:hypothetical protein [Candidatus Syntrophocurvum alkaliphilum]QGT99288.1 hypothetical protein SYNTR_0695 [Candidatus Syntrophocurvum alkaliphilum]